MRQRLWHALLLAVLLVFIQQVVATHAIVHVKVDGAQHLSGGGEAPDCPECLALGGLGFSTPTHFQPDFAAPDGVDRKRLPATPWLASRRASAHAIRAPPLSA